MTLAVADAVWNALIAGAVTVILALMQYLTKKEMREVGKKAKDAANGVEKLLQEENDKTHKKLDAVRDALAAENKRKRRRKKKNPTPPGTTG